MNSILGTATPETVIVEEIEEVSEVEDFNVATVREECGVEA